MTEQLKWSTEYEVGIPLIDKDHKVLVDLLNQVFETMDDEEEKATLGSVLNSLVDYTTYHFIREERLMEVAGYEGTAQHKEVHADLKEQVSKIRDDFSKKPDDVKGEDVAFFLKGWLFDHILGNDMKYVAACSDNPAAIAAASRIDMDGREANASTEAIDWSALKVLVVEDNKNFKLIISTILRSLGVRQISLAEDGVSGLATMSDSDFDIILCDWRMAGMDGLEFVNKVRQGKVNVRIIMMSGYADVDFPVKAREAGVDEFLEKPITAKGFISAALKVLN